MLLTVLQKVSFYFNLIKLLVVDMKRMVQELLTEVETLEQETPASEELYSKLELKVRKKFNEEIDRLEKSFRRIMEQLDIQ
jgi:formiminotetrahydrofolate cyclodeaminase